MLTGVPRRCGPVRPLPPPRKRCGAMQDDGKSAWRRYS